MGLYANLNAVKLRLLGKVRFTEDPDDENEMQTSLANQLVSQAESDLEMDLSPRYAAPFQTDGGQPFSSLPNRPTRLYLVTMAEILSCIRILETDFGRSGDQDPEKYTKALQKRYDGMLDKILKRRKVGGEETQQWMYPPLPSLMLNYQNMAGDDGFMGSVHVTGSGRGDFPEAQINSPGENFWNGQIDALDRRGPDNDGEVL